MFCCYSIEGVVVAKEFEDKLLDAWRRDEEEHEKKEQEVRNISDGVVFIQVINPFVQKLFYVNLKQIDVFSMLKSLLLSKRK